jgi:shikimate kinase
VPARPPAAATVSGSPYRRVVLLGFMTSGKTEVGRSLALRLGWSHIDLDQEIQRVTGRTPERIFAEEGEAGFRKLEVELTPRALAPEHVVLSPGGGWITNPGLLESLPFGTLSVWLKVSPEEVVRRLNSNPHQPVRPLLQSSDPKSRINDLLARREELYRRAEISIETDRRSVSEIVALLESLVRSGKPELTSTNPTHGPE